MSLAGTSVVDLMAELNFPQRLKYVVKRRFTDGTTTGDVMSTLGESRDVRWRAVPTLFPDVPTDGWSSFDRTPWNHPWLTRDNLTNFRRFSDRLLTKWLPLESPQPHEIDVAFVGNMANLNFTRLASLRRAGARAPLYLHPDDHSPFAQPEWEEFDGDVAFDTPIEQVRARLPPVHDVVRIGHDREWYAQDLAHEAPFLKPFDLLRWPSFASLYPLYRALSQHKVLVASQCQFAAYLSGRPYVFGQSGGEIWFEPARDDEWGRLQLHALRKAAAIFVSNPITLAHARRYGLSNVIYFPYCLDEQVYAPGPRDFRAEWQRQIGGDFFVMMSARIDDYWKGSQIALEGFAVFARSYSGARLVVMRWGGNSGELEQRLDALGIRDRVLILPLSGKRRLVRILRSADCLLEQFVLGYYGGSALEAMACGLPVVMRLERAQYEGLLLGDAPPTLDAATPAEVAGKLAWLASSRDTQRSVAEQTRQWFLRNHAGGKFNQQFCGILEKVGSGASLPAALSPLRRFKTRQERDYLYEQLRSAPVFPKYS